MIGPEGVERLCHELEIAPEDVRLHDLVYMMVVIDQIDCKIYDVTSWF